MYSWLGFTQDKLNDVVLTPSYVENLLVKLARVNKDSYVWDFETGIGTYWVEEGQKIETSSPTWKKIKMQAKKLGVIIPVSREFLNCKRPQFLMTHSVRLYQMNCGD